MDSLDKKIYFYIKNFDSKFKSLSEINFVVRKKKVFPQKMYFFKPKIKYLSELNFQKKIKICQKLKIYYRVPVVIYFSSSRVARLKSRSEMEKRKRMSRKRKREITLGKSLSLRKMFDPQMSTLLDQLSATR